MSMLQSPSSPATASATRTWTCPQRIRTSASPSTDVLFTLVGPDAHHHIVSFLLAVVTTPIFPSPFGMYCLDLAEKDQDCSREVLKWKDMTASEKAPYVTRYERYHDFRQTLLPTKRNISLISKLWHDMTRRVIHQCNAPPSAILPSHDFGILKEKVSRLDLKSLYDDFIAMIDTKWNAIGWDHFSSIGGDQTIDKFREAGNLSPMQAFVTKLCEGKYETLAKVCAEEYRRFILVKCIETMARRSTKMPESPLLEMWKQACQPTEPVAMFWRAHMLHSNKYDKDCQNLIGQAIDNECACDDNDGIVAKRGILFAFERQFPPEVYYQCPSYDSSTSPFLWDSLFDGDGEIPGFYNAIVDMIHVAI